MSLSVPLCKHPALAVLSLLAAGTLQAGPPGQVAAYNFNEGTGTQVTDASGSGNHGTISGAVWTAAGRYGGALSFDGVNDLVTVNDAAPLDLTNGMTLSAWIYRQSGTDWSTVLIKERPGGLAYALYGHTDANRPAVAINTGADVNLYGTAQIPLNTWTHLAATFNGATLRLYVNGVQVATRAQTGQMPVSASPLRIGGNTIWGEYFAGRIDDVRIYNRELTAAEIQTDMNTPVSSAPQNGLTVTPSSISFTSAGATQQLTATATYADGTAQNVTSNTVTAYSSSAAAVATVSATGVVSAVANGTATITASHGGFSATSAVTVNIPPVTQTGLTVTPSSFTLTTAGATQPLTVTATYSNGSTQNVTAGAGFASSNAAVATVTTSGLVAAVANGAATITASYGGFSAAAAATVAIPTQTGLTVTPSSVTLSSTGATQQLTVMATFSNGTSQNVTSNPGAAYSSSNPGAATVGATGLVTAAANGTATITASYGGFSNTSSVTVSLPTQTGLTLAPSSATLTALGATQALIATATFSNGTTQNVTTNPGTTYSSNNTAIATVSATGLVTAVAAGSATITGSHGGFSATSSITVNLAPPPSGLVSAYGFNEGSGTAINDASQNANNGTISGATWTTAGRYGGALSFDGINDTVTINSSPSLDLTNRMTIEAWIYRQTGNNWRTILMKERPGGMAYALYGHTDANRPAAAINTGADVNLYGTAQVPLNTWTHLAATYNGATLRLYVNGTQAATRALTGLIPTSISPLRIGGNAIWGEYFAGRIDEVRIYNRELTAAEIQADMNTPVSSAPQNGLTVTPTSITFTSAGATQQLTTTATYADGSTQNVTSNPAATYSSSNTAAATVNSTGLVTAVANGNATITASYGGFSATSAVTVNITPLTQTGLTVSPNSFTLAAAGAAQQLVTSAIYSNGSTQNVTASATYSSNNPAVATVSAAGLVTAVANGTATISASYGGFPAAATATVNTSSGVSGLVGAYSFNEGGGTTVNDTSGRGNTGTISGATWSPAGRFGNALSFDGVNDWVTVNHSPSLALTNGMTLEAWVYPRSLLGWQTAILKEQTSDYAYALYVNNTDVDKPLGNVTIGSVGHSAVGRAQLQMNTWTHLAATYDGSTLKLYVNGEPVNHSASGSIASSTGPLRFGGNAVWGEYFDGLIDEVRIYNRALTLAEIQADMNAPVDPPALSSISLSPATFPMPVAGALQQLTLAATFAGGRTEDATLNTGVTYLSSNPAVASVTPTGLVKAVANGTATITASYAGQSRTSTATVSLTADPAQVGQWSQPVDIGVVGLNSILLRTGKVLLYGGVITSGSAARLLDPVTGVVTAVPNNFTDLFCSGHIGLADGRTLVVGGHDPLNGILGEDDVNLFDPGTQQWSSLPKMGYRRWYPTATTLADGRVLVTSGGTTCLALSCIVDTPEVFNPSTNTWTKLLNAKWPLWYYPFQFLLPDGRILVTGSSEQPVFTRTLDIATQTWTTLSPPVDGGSAAMYLPGKILQSGTASDGGRPDVPARNTSYLLDMTQANPQWQETARMAAPRGYHVLTVLPDGNVLATSGQFTLDGINTANSVRQAELFSPQTQIWKTLSLAQIPRLYHSAALLLPDARVLVSGSGSLYPAVDQSTVEYYSPPYLFKGPRPAITTAPAAVSYGGSFAVDTPDAANIASIALIRPGAMTHQFDQDQRFLNLSFQAGSGTLTVQAPATGNLAPPGYYMLFLVNAQGVPSVARFVRLQ